MEIEVFSKENCGVCQRFKDRVTDLGFSFVSRNIEDYINYRDDWRELKSYEVSASLTMNNNIPPVIRIDGEYYTFASAMKKLKEIKADENK